MILKNNYYYFKKAVPLSTCKKILKAGRKKIIKKATVLDKDLDLKKRNCKIAWINDKWIYDTLGIKERRIAEDNQATSDLAWKAGKEAIKDAKLTVGDIDLIIVATATPDRLAPSTACFVQDKLKAYNAVAFDLAAVCSGFLFSMSVASQYIANGVYHNVLVIGADTFSKITDWSRRDAVFFGDGAVEEGVFYESINFAVLHKLPVLFICENNLYSVYSGLKVRQPEGRIIHKMVEGMGIESDFGDGNKVDEVYKMVSKAKSNILLGKGPQFLEFETYRWREHCGPNFDNDIGYREEQEFLL